MKKLLLFCSVIFFSATVFGQYGTRAVNWPELDDGVSMVKETTVVSEGAASAKITCSENKAAIRSGRWAVTAGAAYNFSVKVMDNNADAKLRFYLYFRDACGTDLETTNKYTEDAADWSTLSFTGTVPEGAVAADLKIKVYDDDENALYLDAASYTENDGANAFENPGFENWAEVTAPTAYCDHQTVSNKNGAYIVASTNAASGKLYLVNESVNVSAVAVLEAAVTAGNGVMATVSAANTNVEMLTAGLDLGSYFCYAVDAANNLSAKARNCVEVALAYDFLPEFWPLYDEGVTLARNQEVVKERFTSMKVTSSEKKAAFRSGRWAVTAGASYELSLSVMDNTADGKLRMYLYFRDACGNDLTSESKYSEDSAEWGSITFSGTVPEGAVGADLKFKVYDDDENPFYLDNAVYTENGGENTFPNPYFEFWQNVTAPRVSCDVQTVGASSGSYAVGATNAEAGFIYLVEETQAAGTVEELEAAVVAGTGAKAAVASGSAEVSTEGLAEATYFMYAVDGNNMMSDKSTSCVEIAADYGFLPDFWTVFDQGVVLHKEKTMVKERSAALKITTSEYKASFRSGSFPVTAGANYSMSIDVRDTTSTSKLRMYFYFRDNCGNDLESASEYSADSTDWSAITFSGVVPENAVSADIKFKVYDKKGHALFIDNASYTEEDGNNVMPNPYFEFWSNVFAPWLRYDSQTVTNGPAASAAYATNAASGTAYVFADTVSTYTVESLNALVEDGKATKAEIPEDAEERKVPTADLIPGSYKLIVVNEAATMSEEFVACLEVIAFDDVPPVVANEVQSATNKAGQQVAAQSNEFGWVYIIKEGEAASRTAELEAAIQAKKGAKAVVTAVDTDMAILTDSLDAGTYYAYAVDAQYNISEKGSNAITISFATSVNDMNALGISIYPNPAKEFVTVSGAANVVRYELINLTGKVVAGADNSQAQLRIDLSELNTGIYMLRLHTNDGKQVLKKLIRR